MRRKGNDGQDLASLVEAWLDEKQTLGRGLSAASEAAYRRDLTGWAWRIAELTNKPGGGGHDRRAAGDLATELARLTLDDISFENVMRALASLAREGYAPASRARMLAALRGFSAWLVRNGHLATDPTTWLDNPAPAERLPVAFLGSELLAILTAVSQVDPTARFPWPLRDRAMVAVLAGAGLRAGELVGLQVVHVIREDDVVLRVIGKGNKERRVPIAADVVKAVDDYMTERVDHLGRPEPTAPLFVRHNGKAFTREALNYHVYKWLHRAGVHKPEGEAAHAFRHTYAKGLVAQGVPVSAVQKLLGHANLDTTSQYLRMTAVELHEAASVAEINAFLRQVPAPVGSDGR